VCAVQHSLFKRVFFYSSPKKQLLPTAASNKKKYNFSIFLGGSQAASNKRKIEVFQAERNSKFLFIQLSAS
jgi:hypothetical protein